MILTPILFQKGRNLNVTMLDKAIEGVENGGRRQILPFKIKNKTNCGKVFCVLRIVGLCNKSP